MPLLHVEKEQSTRCIFLPSSSNSVETNWGRHLSTSFSSRPHTITSRIPTTQSNNPHNRHLRCLYSSSSSSCSSGSTAFSRQTTSHPTASRLMVSQPHPHPSHQYQSHPPIHLHQHRQPRSSNKTRHAASCCLRFLPAPRSLPSSPPFHQRSKLPASATHPPLTVRKSSTMLSSHAQPTHQQPRQPHTPQSSTWKVSARISDRKDMDKWDQQQR